MLILGVVLLVLGSILSLTTANSRQVMRNNIYVSSQSAAEAAVEYAVSAMKRDYIFQALNPASSYTSLIPSTNNWPVAYQFSSSLGNNTTYVNEGPLSTNLQTLTSTYAGLQGYIQECTISSVATPQNQSYAVPGAVTETIQFANIPMFQFAIFYNINLEIAPGNTMVIKGPVFCNAEIWAESSSLNFLSMVSAVNGISQADYDPFSNGFPGRGNPTFSGGTNLGVNALTMPIAGTNNNAAAVHGIIDLPPTAIAAPNAAAYLATNQIYLYNESDLIISNATTGINGSSRARTDLTVYYQNQFRGTVLQAITNDFFIVKNGASSRATNDIRGIASANVLYYGYSFVTNTTFYDYREAATIQAVEIDIAKFNKWLATNTPTGGKQWNDLNTTGPYSEGHNIDSIYVYNNAPSNSTFRPAVRVVNGQMLPTYNGLTISTPQPLYIKGDYNTRTNIGGTISTGTNTAYTYPAAFLADAITIISTNYNDSWGASGAGSTFTARVPSDTTVNAACLEGIVPTDPSIYYDYSGGVENFLRLLENWAGVTLTYNGSIVVMFPSQYATGKWITPGTYYNAPIRNWGFDYNFTVATKMPPLSPQSKAVIRKPGGWAAQ
jgi:hypothetical protein